MHLPITVVSYGKLYDPVQKQKSCCRANPDPRRMNLQAVDSALFLKGGSPMSRKYIGMILAIVGVLVGLVFALADVIGIGTTPGVFGYGQIGGVVLGVVLLVVGLVLYFRKNQT